MSWSTPSAGDVFVESLRALAVEGRLLVVGFAEGSIPTLKVNRLLLHNQSVIGVGLQSVIGVGPGLGLDESPPTYVQQQWARLAPLPESGAIGPKVDMIVPLSRWSARSARPNRSPL